MNTSVFHVSVTHPSHLHALVVVLGKTAEILLSFVGVLAFLLLLPFALIYQHSIRTDVELENEP
jgi:cellobiose-specific phosphotransferase system component IIC